MPAAPSSSTGMSGSQKMEECLRGMQHLPGIVHTPVRGDMTMKHACAGIRVCSEVADIK
jgi:hypothetical protein